MIEVNLCPYLLPCGWCTKYDCPCGEVRNSITESETIREKFAIELKQLVHQKCVEINHYVSGCDSPFSYLQIADVQESLREIENTLNIKVKE